jgi:uncharacterized protein
MLRREFLAAVGKIAGAGWLTPGVGPSEPKGSKLAKAAQTQIGVTVGYDPGYARISYPNGDVPRASGVCADVVVRAARDALSLDLQQLVHEDIVRNFSGYPARQLWGQQRADSNIDHRRVPNLETFWTRAGCELWTARSATAGDAFPKPIQVGDLLTWRLNARLPHVAIVIAHDQLGTSVVHNIGEGARQIPLEAFGPHLANGHYRWPA